MFLLLLLLLFVRFQCARLLLWLLVGTVLLSLLWLPVAVAFIAAVAIVTVGGFVVVAVVIVAVVIVAVLL